MALWANAPANGPSIEKAFTFIAGALAHRRSVRHDQGVQRATLTWAFRRFGPRYPRLVIALLFQVAHLVVAGGVWLLDLYVDLDRGQFWLILVVAEAAVLVENALAIGVVWRLMAPADPWLAGDRSPRAALKAWRALAGVPLAFVRWGARCRSSSTSRRSPRF